MTVEQMADDDYFAFDAVDQTALKKYLVSPLAYSQYLTGEHSSPPSSSSGRRLTVSYWAVAPRCW